MGIFDALHIGYSGLNTSQAGINTTSHNISNANTEGYTRQRITQKSNTPLHSIPGDSGSGVRVGSINRIHNEFVFARARDSASILEYDEFTAIKNFEEVYQWLNYRFLADIPEENLSSNFILFMAVYALLLMSDEKLEKARDVLHFTYSILQPILNQEKEFFDESTRMVSSPYFSKK